jgi:beta-aspartyl-dipeptidase (metallo-type)
MLKLLKNCTVFAPNALGKKDLVIGGGKILAIADSIEAHSAFTTVWDAQGKICTPGLIDQHVHIIGAGGKHGFASMTPEINLSEFIACGSTTVVGLLGTDASTRSVKTLYAKTKSLDQEGITAYMFTSYFGIDPITLTGSIQDDMILIDKVIGCKVAISDERSSYPTTLELLRHLRDIHVGGLISGKGGVLHVHLGGQTTKMDILFELVQQHEFPIKHISPTHVGRSKDLFDQALEFAKIGGMIDITTGASKYTDPWKSVAYAMDQGVSTTQLSFSSDGHAGLAKKAPDGSSILTKAPIFQNLEQVKELINNKVLGIGEAFSLVTSNPAKNLSLKHKGKIAVGADADLCFFDEKITLTDVWARGNMMMENEQVLVKGSFEK